MKDRLNDETIYGVNKQLVELYESCSNGTLPEFLSLHDGERLAIMDQMIHFPSGWGIDGNLPAEITSLFRGVVIPIKSVDRDSGDEATRKVLDEYYNFKQKFSDSTILAIVRDQDNAPFGHWNIGPILIEDLNKDRQQLNKEAYEALLSSQDESIRYEKKDMKRRAALAITPIGEIDSIVSFWELLGADIEFQYPHAIKL